MKKNSRLKEFLITLAGAVIILPIVFGLLYVCVAMDDSPNKCVSKTVTRVYDPECF